VQGGSGAATSDHGYPLDDTCDFTTGMRPAKLAGIVISVIITNPPGGPRNKTAEQFIAAGLRHLQQQGGGLLALLLPIDFDSAGSRRQWFADCQEFAAKIVLTKRIVWFERTDGKREAPKENHAWFLWQRTPLRIRNVQQLLYLPTGFTDDRRNATIPTSAAANPAPNPEFALFDCLGDQAAS
jgi:hypothetical protein